MGLQRYDFFLKYANMNETFYHILPSGTQIVVRNVPSAVVYLGIMVGAGTRHEAEDVSGIAHYIEHCVFKGTLHHTARQIIRRVEDIGGEINAYTTKEETTFYAAVPRTYWKRTLHLLGEMVMQPTFPKKETDKEVQVIYDEIESYNDSPSELIYDDFESLIFRGNSLASPILGTKKSLRHISSRPGYALRFMQEYYRPERMVFFCQGNINAKKFAEEVGKMMEIAPNQAFPPQGKDVIQRVESGKLRMENGEERIQTYKKHTHQTHVMLGGISYPLGHPKQLSMYLLNNILGGGSLSSRLNLSIREQQGLVYTIESQYTPLSDTGYWSVYFACEPQHKDECVQRIRKELADLRNKPLTPHAFKQALEQIRGQMAISAENRENNALAMAKQMLYYGKAPLWEETYAKLAQLTPNDLYEVANEMFPEENWYILTYE